jgi:hypothetical protein
MPNDPELMRKWVETWQRAAPELERIYRAELQAIDTQEAIRQIFGSYVYSAAPAPATSGLVEQQAWFMRMREAQKKP